MEILRKKMRHAVADATTKVRAQIPREEVMYTSIVELGGYMRKATIACLV